MQFDIFAFSHATHVDMEMEGIGKFGLKDELRQPPEFNMDR
jgi:hypothetical protein